MALGFSDIDEQYEYDSEMYDTGCSILGSSDDNEYAESASEKADSDCSLLGVKT